jgi:hypothetical protein
MSDVGRHAIAHAGFTLEAQAYPPEGSHDVQAELDQVKDVSDEERDAAWKRIQAAAKKFHVELHETSWRELGHKK